VLRVEPGVKVFGFLTTHWGCFPDRSEEVKRLPLALDSYWRPGQPMMIEIWEAIFHSIGLRENLQENPIFHGTKTWFLDVSCRFSLQPIQ